MDAKRTVMIIIFGEVIQANPISYGFWKVIWEVREADGIQHESHKSITFSLSKWVFPLRVQIPAGLTRTKNAQSRYCIHPLAQMRTSMAERFNCRSIIAVCLSCWTRTETVHCPRGEQEERRMPSFCLLRSAVQHTGSRLHCLRVASVQVAHYGPVLSFKIAKVDVFFKMQSITTNFRVNM